MPCTLNTFMRTEHRRLSLTNYQETSAPNPFDFSTCLVSYATKSTAT